MTAGDSFRRLRAAIGLDRGAFVNESSKIPEQPVNSARAQLGGRSTTATPARSGVINIRG
jgi:hypothetical protein